MVHFLVLGVVLLLRACRLSFGGISAMSQLPTLYIYSWLETEKTTSVMVYISV